MLFQILSIYKEDLNKLHDATEAWIQLDSLHFSEFLIVAQGKQRLV
jgi:hypothetical protein